MVGGGEADNRTIDVGPTFEIPPVLRILMRFVLSTIEEASFKLKGAGSLPLETSFEMHFPLFVFTDWFLSSDLD